MFNLACVRESSTRAYLVQHVPTGERGGLYVKAGAGATSDGFASASPLVLEALSGARSAESFAAMGAAR